MHHQSPCTPARHQATARTPRRLRHQPPPTGVQDGPALPSGETRPEYVRTGCAGSRPARPTHTEDNHSRDNVVPVQPVALYLLLVLLYIRHLVFQLLAQVDHPYLHQRLVVLVELRFVVELVMLVVELLLLEL